MDKISVMICDDSALMRNLIGRIIADYDGLEVVGKAENGQDLLDKIPVYKPDVILLDIEMPVECYEETTPESIKRLYVKDDLLKGFLLIGCHERAGIYTSLIRNRTPLSEIDFELMKQGATTAAFSSENRRKKFGGVV